MISKELTAMQICKISLEPEPGSSGSLLASLVTCSCFNRARLFSQHKSNSPVFVYRIVVVHGEVFTLFSVIFFTGLFTWR